MNPMSKRDWKHLLESVLGELEIPFSSFKTIDKEKEYLVFGSFSVAETFLKKMT